MNRGNITVRPQQGVSYSNPNMQAPQRQPVTPTTQTQQAIFFCFGMMITAVVLP